MTEIIIRGVQSYTLPLESIDLTYLSKYVQNPRDEKVPIWSKQRLDGESKYYQVQIMARDIHEDSYFLEPIETYKCHICNLDVPKICYKEHNESKNHETYKKICENILERVSKQINLSMINNDREIAKDVYYCVSCSKLIQIENKYKHEASDYHTNSLEKVNILNDFYDIFTKQENKVIDKQDLILNEDTKFEFNKQKESKTKTTESDDNLWGLTYGSDHNFESNHNFEPILDLPYGNSSFQSDGSAKKNSFEIYLKEMKEKYKLKVTLPQTDGDNIYIVNTNCEKLKISHENFHSYRDVNYCTYCQMCKMWISHETTAHDVSENHVRNVFKPINDKFARMMDSVSSHCIICNEVVLTESDHHKLSDNHTNIPNDTKIARKSQYNLIAKTGKTLCDICNVYIDSHNYVEHTNSKNHKSKEPSRQINLESEKINKTNTNEYSCRFRNITLIDNNLISHMNSDAHLEKNKLSGEYCEICKVSVPKGGMKTHTEGKPHRQVMINEVKAFREIKNEILDSRENNNTKAANGSTQSVNTSVNNTTNKNEIIASTSTNSCNNMSNNNTTKNKDKIISYYKLLRYPDDTNTQTKCSICNVEVPYLERNIIEHMEGRNHLEAVAKINKTKKYSSALVNNTTNKNESIDVTGINSSNNATNDTVRKDKIDDYYELLRYIDDEKTKVKCSICNVEIPNLVENIIVHMEGKKHLKKSKRNQLKNDSTVVVNNNPVKNECIASTSTTTNSCNNIMAYNKTGTDKIGSYYYEVLQFSNDTKTEVECSICLTLLKNQERTIIDHMESKCHLQNVSMKNKFSCYRLNLLSSTGEPTEVLCNICDMKIRNEDGECREIIKHNEGKKHTDELYKLLSFHKISKRYANLNYYCEYCDLEIIIYLDHINSRMHIENYQSKWYQ